MLQTRWISFTIFFITFTISLAQNKNQNLFWEQGYLLGTFGGKRTSLENSGIDFQFAYTADIIGYVSGGIESGSDYSDNFDLTGTFDFEKLFGWKGATLFTYILGNHGGIVELSSGYAQGIANRTGAIQGISNIAAYSTWKLYEFWLEQKLLDDKLSVLFGLYDLNSEFDVQESSSIFINPSHGIGAEYAQSGENGPSIFPTTSVALRLNYTPTENLYFKLGIFDGIPGTPENPNRTQIKFGKNDGFLIAYEMGLFENGTKPPKGFGKYSIGGWYYTEEFESIMETNQDGKPKMRNDNFGLYLSAEKFLISEESDESQGLSAFLRTGIANGKVNLIDYYWGIGFSYFGLIPGRDNDVIGLAVATSHNGNEFRKLATNFYNVELEASEMIFELTYSLQLLPWFRVQPDFQYVINPVGSIENKTATVAVCRMEVIF